MGDVENSLFNNPTLIMKSNILVVYPGLDVSAIIGVIKPLNYLYQKGFITLTHKPTTTVTDLDILNSNVIILVRELTFTAVNLCLKANRLKKCLIYYSDDNLLDVPTYSLSYKYLSNPKIKNNIMKILKFSNYLWAVNKNLVKKYSPFISHSFVTNAVATLVETACNSPKNPNDKIVIGFAGGLDNTFFINNFFKPILIELYKIYGDKIHFEIFGSDQEFLKNNPYDNISYIPYESDLEKYSTIMKNINWDIGVAPLGNSSFNSCKYYNKFMEYGGAKIPGVYSNVEPFTFVVKDAINGLLLDNSKELWVKSISNLIENEYLRRLICKNAFNFLQKYNTSEYVGNEFMIAMKSRGIF